MKKLLFFLLVVPLISFSQDEENLAEDGTSLSDYMKRAEKNVLLTESDILKIYPTAVGGYFDAEGKLLFDGGGYDADSDDKFKIETYQGRYFKGKFLESENCNIIWYSDSDGKLISLKNIYFKSGKKNDNGYFPLIGSEIFYYPNGKIKNILNQ